jgi:hypothetical protein
MGFTFGEAALIQPGIRPEVSRSSVCSPVSGCCRMTQCSWLRARRCNAAALHQRRDLETENLGIFCVMRPHMGLM